MGRGQLESFDVPPYLLHLLAHLLLLLGTHLLQQVHSMSILCMVLDVVVLRARDCPFVLSETALKFLEQLKEARQHTDTW